MKKLVVFSDIHYNCVPEKVKSVANEADCLFFLGDGGSRLGDLLFSKNLVAVKGNCDDTPFPREAVVEIEGVKVLATHGDLYSVKRDLLPLSYRAKELGCSLVLYGHTHLAEIIEEDGITFVNPGAIHSPQTGTPSYAYIVVVGDKVTAKIVDIY